MAPEGKPSAAMSAEIDLNAIMGATKLTVARHEPLDQFLKRITHLALQGAPPKRVFTRIQNLDVCPNLKVLYLYDNQLVRLENLESATHLTHLHVQNNRIQRIEHLAALGHLEKLYVSRIQIDIPSV